MFEGSSAPVNSAASAGEALFGEEERDDPMNGKNVDERVGECDEVLGSNGGISMAVRDLVCPRVGAGGGRLGILLSSKCSFFHVGEDMLASVCASCLT